MRDDDPDFRFNGAGRYTDTFGHQFWLDDKQRYHRTDGPAIIDAERNEAWYFEDKMHRPGDLPAMECSNGDKAWYEEGECHRIGAPAITRTDGASEWWVRGRQLSPAEIEDVLFSQGDPATVARRGAEAKQAFGAGLRTPITASRPLNFINRKL